MGRRFDFMKAHKNVSKLPYSEVLLRATVVVETIDEYKSTIDSWKLPVEVAPVRARLDEMNVELTAVYREIDRYIKHSQKIAAEETGEYRQQRKILEPKHIWRNRCLRATLRNAPVSSLLRLFKSG